MSSPAVRTPVFEHHHNGLGVGVARPRLSWQFDSLPDTAQGWIQTAYDIEIRFSSSWDIVGIYHVKSPQSVLVPWPTRSLASRESAQVRVRVYGKATGQNCISSASSLEPSGWSPPSSVETALLDYTDFYANFITSAERIESPGPLRPIRFRKSFYLPDTFLGCGSLSARLYITALGVFKVWINGQVIGDEFMAPGWTSYKHRLVYRIHDVSMLIRAGEMNVICAEVAEGWYAGRLGFDGGRRFRYGDELALFSQLEVRTNTWTDPSSDSFKVLTDDTWSAMPSAIVSSSIYDGEILDCSSEVEAWTEPSTEWPADKTTATRVLTNPQCGKLVAPDAPPIRTTQRIACKQVLKSKTGKIILDFGQNLVGKVLIPSLELLNGETVTLRHAEVLEHGELGTRPLREAKCMDKIIGAAGKKLMDWTPSFTFHGFRYVQVDGWPSRKPSPEALCALVIHTDMKRRGFFECSNRAVNQLHSNVVWSMRGNFLSIPTDCPQRDERLGWTGDLQVFCRTATYLYDTLGVLANWLEDVSAEQLEPERGGVVPLVVPEAMPKDWPREANCQAIWGDVSILAPKDLFDYSMDKDLLSRQLGSMQAWIDRGIVRAADGLWDPNLSQLADWLDPNAPPDDPAQASTDSLLVANAYLVHVTLVFADLCAELGKEALAAKYKQQGARLRQLFQDRYITPHGNLVSLSQTGISLAIVFNLFRNDDPQRHVAADTLKRLVRKAKYRIATGFAGTPVITHALTRIGRPQLSYGMLLQTECPGWLYPVIKHGATTIWERWDSMLQNGNINPGEMTSFNHYALGAVADWLHSSVGGISPMEPGWKVIRVRPVPGGNLRSARVSFDGPYGLIECQWVLNGTNFQMKIIVPPNCQAVVTLPSELIRDYSLQGETTRTVGSGLHEFNCEYISDEWPPHAIGHHFKRDETLDVPVADGIVFE
ncbi:hypothetical protein FANTH_9256 [Fusarium anthophilum]|uniref:alpha-L-rhamnosidase n=1 Tax=Fusarium anthophilum TaxID=48485 RepID=A0A8H5DYX8_9HYPO|nr:hypothetical protein FANTH_9256 [Fusarium anthophilum]